MHRQSTHINLSVCKDSICVLHQSRYFALLLFFQPRDSAYCEQLVVERFSQAWEDQCCPFSETTVIRLSCSLLRNSFWPDLCSDLSNLSICLPQSNNWVAYAIIDHSETNLVDFTPVTSLVMQVTPRLLRHYAGCSCRFYGDLLL